MHNTYIPTEAQWSGSSSMNYMMHSYIAKGWTSGPHLYLACHSRKKEWDGIWQLTPLIRRGTHAGDCNTNSFGIEVCGDFQMKPWSAEQRHLLLDTLEVLHRWANLPPSAVNGHRDCMQGRTCPGNVAYAALPQLRADLATALRSVSAGPPRFRVTALSARIRLKATTRSAQTGSLKRGAIVTGEIVKGLQLTSETGKPDGRWLRMGVGRYVWAGLLEEVLP